jgi:hypothetical protein
MSDLQMAPSTESARKSKRELALNSFEECVKMLPSPTYRDPSGIVQDSPYNSLNQFLRSLLPVVQKAFGHGATEVKFGGLRCLPPINYSQINQLKEILTECGFLNIMIIEKLQPDDDRFYALPYLKFSFPNEASNPGSPTT